MCNNRENIVELHEDVCKMLIMQNQHVAVKCDNIEQLKGLSVKTDFDN